MDVTHEDRMKAYLMGWAYRKGENMRKGLPDDGVTYQQMELAYYMGLATRKGEEMRLAEMAVRETGFGNVQDKVTKNRFASQRVWEAVKDMKTVGVLKEDPREKLWEVGVPVGTIAAIVPSTNPTSTVCYKALIALKSGNSIVFSPHPKAIACTMQAARIAAAAAEKAGAPKGAVSCLSIATLDGCKELMSGNETNLILATGGRSYPRTGSEGDGYRMAQALGHTVTALRPSLVPLLTEEHSPAQMEGLALKNVTLTVKKDGKKIFSDFGEMVFTAKGISGPLVLSASAHLGVKKHTYPYQAFIDLKPALDADTLDKRLLRDFEENINRDFANALSSHVV